MGAGRKVFEFRWSPSPIVSYAIVAGTVCLSTWLYVRPAFRPKKQPRPAQSPAGLLRADDNTHPYPLDVLPGGRSVPTPYGSMRVFEWGAEDGAKVLLLHGIGTPCLALGELASRLVDKGCRVMLFGKLSGPLSDRWSGIMTREPDDSLGCTFSHCLTLPSGLVVS